jgi:hypothetical protein
MKLDADSEGTNIEGIGHDLLVKHRDEPMRGLSQINKKISHKRSTRCAMAEACSVVLCLLTVSAAQLVAGAPGIDPANIEGDHPTSHVADHEGMAWPPKPEGITNIRVLSNAASQKLLNDAEIRRKNAIEAPIRARRDVKLALGTRFNKATMIEDEPKDGSEPNTRLVYFSHSNNSTVEVYMRGEKTQKVLSVKKIPPSVYQPEITDEEIAEAEKIARAYYASQGQNRVAELQAFGILAYKPEGKGFYDTRVIYISFHPNSDSQPEFMAWVDLTNQTVIRAREEQP